MQVHSYAKLFPECQGRAVKLADDIKGHSLLHAQCASRRSARISCTCARQPQAPPSAALNNSLMHFDYYRAVIIRGWLGNRRRSIREDYEKLGTISGAWGEMPILIRDINTTGLALWTGRVPNPDEDYTITLHSEGKTYTAAIEVIRFERVDAWRFEWGCEFRSD